MKKIKGILLMLVVALTAYSQEIRVEEFRMLSHDLTANIKGTERFDPNTRKNAALIKIETTEKGFYFDGGMMGLVGDPIQNAGEIWVYIPEGSKKITLRHSELGTLRDYFYPEKIISGRTYLMKLTTTPKTENLSITIYCAKSGAEVYLDGSEKGKIPGNNILGIPNVTSGTHILKVQYGSDISEETIEVNKNSFSFNVTLNKAPSQTHNGHEYVDLGLSVKWATCNVGASTPEEYGDYFAWGETELKKIYTKEGYKFLKGKLGLGAVAKYCSTFGQGKRDNKTTLELSDDVANANWGGSWRMPTKAEQDELRDTNNCTWTWTSQNEVNGYEVTSKKNGNSIFLPAAGFRYNSTLFNVGKYGYYWSSSLYTSDSSRAYYVSFDSGFVDWSDYYRYYGHSVRAVCE